MNKIFEVTQISNSILMVVYFIVFFYFSKFEIFVFASLFYSHFLSNKMLLKMFLISDNFFLIIV